MADQRVRSCIQRVEDAEAQMLKFASMLSETREDLNAALGEILSGVKGSTFQHPKQALDTPATPDTSEPEPAQPGDVPKTKTGEVTGEVLQNMQEGAADEESIQKAKDLEEIANSTGAKLGITGQEVMTAFNCFSTCDVDNSGKVSSSELPSLLETLTGEPLDKGEAHRILKKFDKDENGELDFEEFLYCYCYTPQKKKEHLKAALCCADDKMDQRFRTRMVGVSADDLQSYLAKELEEESAFLSIPLVILLFMFFLIALSLHRNTGIMNSLERAVEFDITENANFAFVGAAPFENGRMGHKGLHDVNSFADFWSWLDLGLVPLFFPSGWSISEARSNVAARCTSPYDAMAGFAMTKGQATANTPYGPWANASHASVTGDLGPNLCNMGDDTNFPAGLNLEAFSESTKAPYLFFNEIIGGVRMRQEQLPVVDCADTKYFGHTYNTPCIEVNEGAWLPPDLDAVLHVDADKIDKPGGESVYFRSGMDLKDVHSSVRILENRRWLNQRTGRIEITFATYNNHVDMFVGVFIDLFITRGGRIHKIIKPISFSMNPYSNPWSYVFDVAFALLVLQLFVSEARCICSTIKEYGLRPGLKKYFYDFKNIVDWACLAYSTVVFVMWANWCFTVLDLSNMLLTANTSVKGSWDSGVNTDIYTPSKAEFWKSLDNCAEFEESLQNVLAFYPILLAMRFVTAFTAQPRLALVTKTLAAAGSELLHFGVVMGVTIMTFTASAMILFGREVEEFENFGRAFVAVVQGLLGDFDYDSLIETGRLPANIWWSVFTILGNICMLNMVLAIIMDNYAEVKASVMSGDIEDFPTIATQAHEIFRRWKQKRAGLRVGLGYILHCLEKHDAEERFVRKGAEESKLITTGVMTHLVPGLGKKQAERLLTNARNFFDSRGTTLGGINDCLNSLRGVDLKVQQVHALTQVLDDHTAMALRAVDRLSGVVPKDSQYSTSTLGAGMRSGGRPVSVLV